MSKYRKVGEGLTALLSLSAVVIAGIIVLIPLIARFQPGIDYLQLQQTAEWLLQDNRVILICGGLFIVALFFYWLTHRQRLNTPAIQSPNKFSAPRAVSSASRTTPRPLVSNALTISLDSVSRTQAIHGYDDAAQDSNQIGNRAAIQSAGAAALPFVGENEFAVGPYLEPRTLSDSLIYYGNKSLAVAIFYLVALTVAEVIAVLVSPVTGVTLHMVILFTLLVHAAFTWSLPIHRLLLTLTLVPLIRVISLSLPLVSFPLTYWFFITSVPLFSAAYVIMLELGFTWREVIGFRWRGLPLQLLIASTGILLGITEYIILKPEPLIAEFSWQEFIVPALILLISTGFLEEYIFRFLLQRTAIERLGVAIGISYGAIFFAVLHIGYRSVTDFLFVLFVGFFFGVATYRTGSILGVTLAHGLTNIMLFLIMPFVAFSAPSLNESDLQSYWQSFSSLPAIEQLIEPQEWDIDSFIKSLSSVDSDPSAYGDQAYDELAAEEQIAPVSEKLALPLEEDVGSNEFSENRFPSPFRVITYSDFLPVPD
jgi:membrane protease YdiL (CAAX protease family)